MFLIYEENEKSMTPVDNDFVVCDHKSVQVGDEVKFLYGNKLYSGVVKLISDDKNLIDKYVMDFKKGKVIPKGDDDKPGRTRSVAKKSNDVKEKPSVSNVAKKKKETQKRKRSEEQKIKVAKAKLEKDDPDFDAISNHSDSSSISADTSDDEKELRKKKKDSSTIKKSTTVNHKNTEKSTMNNPEDELGLTTHVDLTNERELKQVEEKFFQEKKGESIELNDDDSEDFDGWQLYGKNYEDPADREVKRPAKMKKIGDEIYCIRKIWSAATSNAKIATHMARQLLVGVFNKDAIQRCTISGTAVRSLGEERKSECTETMHPKAVEAIISYSNNYKSDEKWKADKKTIRTSMSTRLTELKRMLRANPEARLV